MTNLYKIKLALSFVVDVENANPNGDPLSGKYAVPMLKGMVSLAM